MTESARIADRYIDTWNETDPERRRLLLQQAWTPDATYVDPLARAAGPHEIDTLIAGVQARFPGWRFTLSGTPDAHGEHLRFSWALGPAGTGAVIEGTDFVTLHGERMKSVIGFLDKVPAGA